MSIEMKQAFCTAALLGLLCGVGLAQRSTEIFTPIGRSPGLSGHYTVVGSVRDVDASARTVRVVDPDSEKEWIVQVTDSTKIWLDRSRARRTNEAGSFGDLTESSRVEVLYVDREASDGGAAEWIKVEVLDEDS